MSATPKDTTLDARLIKALGHPLRQRVLLRYHERVTSPRAVALELDERLGNVAYHTRILLDAECIELVRTEPRRGALEHFYQAKVRPWLTDQQFAELPLEVRRGIFGDLLTQIQSDLQGAARTGGFDDPEAHVSRTPLRLDPQAWEEMTALLSSTLEQALRIHTESLVRTAKDPSGVRETELAVLHFVRAPDDR